MHKTALFYDYGDFNFISIKYDSALQNVKQLSACNNTWPGLM